MALSLVWIVGLASLVIDIGGGWLSRQTLIPATDAAALAAAQDLVDRPWDEAGACVTAGTYVAGNAPLGAMTGCDVISNSSGGRITVAASEDLETVLVDLGSGGESVQSVSTATWGPPLTLSGLRPLGLCYDGSPALRQLIDTPPTSPSWVEIPFIKTDPAACGGLSFITNFLTLDFEGASALHEIRGWMLHGYPGQIGFDDPIVTTCGGGATCYQRPYALLSLTWQLQSLVNSRSYVSFPVFNYADVDEVHLIGMVRARLYAFSLDGPAESWRIELKVDPGLVTGTCCGQPGVLSGNKVIAICGVDPDAYLACEPSP